MASTFTNKIHSPYTLNLDGLTNESAILDFPKHRRNTTEARKIFETWTQDSQSPIFSGYQQSCYDQEVLFDCQKLTEQLRKDFSCLVVFGIGGSALGGLSVVRALEPLVPHNQRKRVEFCDNLDPVAFEFLWQTLDIERTVFAFISKSGSTVETLTQLAVVSDRLKKAKKDFSSQIIVVTDPKNGALRKWVENKALRSLTVPDSVGGRFSVFTSVGLLPIAFCGINIEEFVSGAKEHFDSTSLETNKVFDLAERLFDCEEGGIRAHCFWPYATVLKFISSWFVQLWGESLGKKNFQNVSLGTIPVPGIGATDQHSFLQLLVEGRKNTVIGFLKIKNWPTIGTFSNIVPRMDIEFNGLSYLTGKTMGEILNAELQATETSLIQANRPTYRIELETLSPRCLGALLALYMDLTTYTAALMKVNPFDQPGVEAGKIELKKLLNFSHDV
jgi:glucose-6-phosphate isomerase